MEHEVDDTSYACQYEALDNWLIFCIHSFQYSSIVREADKYTIILLLFYLLLLYVIKNNNIQTFIIVLNQLINVLTIYYLIISFNIVYFIIIF